MACARIEIEFIDQPSLDDLILIGFDVSLINEISKISRFNTFDYTSGTGLLTLDQLAWDFQ